MAEAPPVAEDGGPVVGKDSASMRVLCAAGSLGGLPNLAHAGIRGICVGRRRSNRQLGFDGLTCGEVGRLLVGLGL